MSEFDEKDTLTSESEKVSQASPLSEEGYSPFANGDMPTTSPAMGPEPYSGAEVISGVEVAKGSPKKIIAIIIAAVIALFALCGAAYAFVPQVSNFVRSTFTSDSSYYHWIEEKSLADGTDELTDSLDKAKDYTGINMKAELKPDNEGISKLAESQGGSMNGFIIPDIGYEIKAAGIDGVMNENLALSANGEQLVSANAYVKDGKIYYQIPELSGDYICLDPVSMIDKALESGKESGSLDENGEKVFDTVKGLMGNMTGEDGELISSKDLNTLIKRYGSVIFDSISDVEKETGVEVEADGIKSKYTRLTAEINEGALFHMAKAGIDELKDDSILKDLVTDKFGVSEDDYEKVIDGLKEQIKQYDEVSGGKTFCTMDVYVNSRGDIVGRTLNFDTNDSNNNDNGFHADTSIGYLITNDGDDYGYSIYADVNGERYSLDGNANKDGGKYTGKASLALADKKDIISLSYENLEKVDDEFINGSITLGLSSIGFDDITIDFEEKDDTQYIKSDLTYSGTKLMSVAAEYNRKDPEKITVFNDGANVYELENAQDYVKSIDKSKLGELTRKLFKAMGLTDEQIDQMTGGEDLGTAVGQELDKQFQMSDAADMLTERAERLITGEDPIDAAEEILTPDDSGLDDMLTPDTDKPDEISESSSADEEYDSGVAEARYDLSKIKVQLDGKDIKLPGRIEGIDKMVKFDSDKLEANYGYASGNTEDYSFNVSVTNTTDKEVSVKDADVTHISVSDTSTHKLTIDGIGCGDDMSKVAEKYGVTLKDPDSGYVEIKNTDGYNCISVMYSGGKIWNISVSMYE